MADTQAAHMSQPFWKYKSKASKSWTTTGNSDTITDTAILDNSYIVIVHTSAPVGTWYVSAVSNGSATITSSDTESAGTTYNYIIL